MTKKYSKYGAVGFNAKTSPSQLIQKPSDDKQHTLYQELKSSGSIDNPVKYTQTHLEGDIHYEL